MTISTAISVILLAIAFGLLVQVVIDIIVDMFD